MSEILAEIPNKQNDTRDRKLVFGKGGKVIKSHLIRHYDAEDFGANAAIDAAGQLIVSPHDADMVAIFCGGRIESMWGLNPNIVDNTVHPRFRWEIYANNK